MTPTQADLDFYAPPIDYVEDRTPCQGPNGYLIGWFTDRDVEWLAAGLVTDAMRERAKALLTWKNRYWQGSDAAAADGAHELYLELVAYGLEP